jgi:hypothetical protein
MFKLVAVGGKIRGQEIELNEGENSIGRASTCEHVLGLQGISKKHLNITVNRNSAFVEDLGSSNGTFVNGKLVKKKTIKNGDKIALPNVIFQVVHVPERDVDMSDMTVQGDVEAEDVNFVYQEEKPQHLVGQIKYMFKTKVMPIVYGFNEQYEWSFIFGFLLFLFISLNIALTIFPVLRTSKSLLVVEVAKRGMHYADEVARLNAIALQRKDLDNLNTTFLDGEDGVISYELYDLEGRIVRPLSKLNQYTNDTFSIDTKERIKRDPNKEVVRMLEGGQIGIGGPINAINLRTGQQEVLGYISIRFKPTTLIAEASTSKSSYLEALTTSILVAIVFFGFIYYLTTKHITDTYIQIEESLRGKRKELQSNLLMEELNPLRNSINSLLQRVRESQSEEGESFGEVEEEGPYLQKLEDFMEGAQGPVLILNAEKNIVRINMEGEDLLGIRENASEGMSLLDTARDQGFAATTIDLCDQSASNEGTNQKDLYEIGGEEYNVNVVALMGKDNFAKGFYITFVRE